MRFYNPENCSREECDDVASALQRGLVPSVTTILSVIHYPHLETWRIRQSLERFKRTGDILDARSYRNDAGAQFGTICHALLEAHLLGIKCEVPHDRSHQQTIQPLLRWLHKNAAEVIFSESMFADAHLGYGGTADMLLKLNDGRLLLADLKCKKHSQKFPMRPDIIYRYQLSAYRKHFARHYGEMAIGNFLLASPFGTSPQPCLRFCDYRNEDWMPGFHAAHRLWREQQESS